MTLARALLLAACLATGFAGAPVLANPAVAILPSAMVGKGCTFYAQPDGADGGWHVAATLMTDSKPSQDTYTRSVKRLSPAWNQRIASIQCDDSDTVHCSIGVYTLPLKRGANAIFWGSQGLFNLSDFGWADTISSYQIFCNLMK